MKMSKRTQGSRWGPAALKALSEQRIACCILDWLADDGLIDCYELDIEGDGSSRVCCYLTGGASQLELRSVLGPVEVAVDAARRVIGG